MADERAAGIAEQEENRRNDHFLQTIRQVKDKAVLLQRENGTFYRAVYVSDKFAEMMGGSVEQLTERMTGTGLVMTTHPDDRLAVRRMLRRRKAQDGSTDLTIRKLRMDGSVIWCWVHFTFIHDFGRRFVYCAYQDVTLQKDYEERLRSTYMSLGGNFYRKKDWALGMFRVNLTKDRIEDVQGMDLFGSDSVVRPYSEAIRLRAWNYPIPEEQERFLELFDREKLISDFEDGNTQLSHHFLSQRRDGRLCFVKVTAVLTHHPMNGNVIAFIKELECNREKVIDTLLGKILSRQFDMVAYLANGRYGIVIGEDQKKEKGDIFPLEREGDYIDWLANQVIPSLCGTEEECCRIEEALIPEVIEEKVAEHEPYIVNVPIRMGGEVYHKRFDFYCIDPRAKFYVLLKSDDTEAQREQYERNMQLQDALAEARKASDAKTVFLSRMSHEIRTPLNAVIGLGNLALQEEMSGKLRGQLTKINSSARYLLALVNDILDMSRIESGREPLRFEEFSFKGVLDQVNTMMDGQCRDKGVRYSCVIQGVIGEYYTGDETKLKQILINILGNAVKFTPAGGQVTLEVCRTEQFEEQCRLSFVIRDTGIGISEAYLPQIYEPFSQEDESIGTVYGGSGLGLAITKSYTDMMGGTISVESEKGAGTTVTFDVVLERNDQAGQQQYGLDLASLKVLIVDDEPAVCRHAQMGLGELGVHADVCTSGKEALDKLELQIARRQEYDLILLDGRMEEMDGIELTRQIRQVLGDHSSVIFLTDYNWLDIKEKAVAAGVDGFLPKPLFASKLLEELEAARRRREKEGTDSGKSRDQLAGARILLAEDVFLNAEIMIQILAMEDITVEHYENGKLAVEAFEDSPQGYFDAVLMDIRMPVMNGLDAAREIRGLDHPDAERVPIIAMTANAFDKDVQLSMDAGMDAHLTKPVEPDRLFRTLGELLRGKE